jgi:sec-independent protein translocase protein TatA
MFRDIGAPEIALIVIIIILVFGAGKLAGVGGALGRSIREFRRELRGEGEKDDKRGNTQQLTTKESREEKGTPPEAKSKEESKD